MFTISLSGTSDSTYKKNRFGCLEDESGNLKNDKKRRKRSDMKLESRARPTAIARGIKIGLFIA